MEEKLIELRERVENQKIISNGKPIHIKIAKDYFEENVDFSLRIIDLPGKGSSNKKEEEHVDAILSRYSSIATTIIFVSNIKQIKGLQDLIDSYSFTKYYPEKCKAVLTFSFSADSVETELDSLLEKKGLKLDTFKNIIEKELTETFSDDFGKYDFFPLEYGDSLETKLEHCLTQEKETIKEIVNTILGELKEKIQKSSSEYSKLVQNHKLPEKIQELIRGKNGEINLINEIFNKEQDIFTRKVNKSKDELLNLKNHFDETNEELKKKLPLEIVNDSLKNKESQSFNITLL
ncbi:MAG: hypothetical protein IPG24_16145 [Leptospiraceae bacterium]|nr:hypothetical protein [Leptospiraceae bacterium]